MANMARADKTTHQVLPKANPAASYLMALMPGESRRTTKSILDTTAKFFSPQSNALSYPWHTLRHENMLLLRSHLALNSPPATANRALSAVRGVLREAWRMHLLTGDDLQRLLDLKLVRGTRLSPRRQLEMDEVRALIGVASSHRSKRTATRHVAMFGLLFGAGLRRSEVAGLLVENCHREGKRYRVVVIGKGNKEREVPLPFSASNHLHAWLQLLERDVGPVFSHRSSEERCMCPESVRYVVFRAAQRAGLAPTTTHDARHTFISTLLDAQVDLGAVQALAGHSTPTTTLRYDRRGYRSKVHAVDQLPQL